MYVYEIKRRDGERKSRANKQTEKGKSACTYLCMCSANLDIIRLYYPLYMKCTYIYQKQDERVSE